MSLNIKILLLLSFVLYLKGHTQNLDFVARDGNRKEGIKNVGIGAPNIELISFLGYKEKVNTSSNIVLKLRFYIKKENSLFITAKEMQTNHAYFMEPSKISWDIGWQEFPYWPTKEVLKPLEISIDDLAVIGRIGTSKPRSGEIVPLILYHSNPPTKIDEYQLYFQSKESLERANYSLFDKDDYLLKQGTLMDLIGGVPFLVNLDFNNLKEGYYKLRLRCEYEYRTGGLTRTYNFYHRP